MVLRRTLCAVMAEPAMLAISLKLMFLPVSVDRFGQTLELHVEKREAHLKIRTVLRKLGLLDAELDGVAVFADMLGQAVAHLRPARQRQPARLIAAASHALHAGAKVHVARQIA